MNYSEIKYCDIANGIGVRTSLFVSGCRNKCVGCFNPKTWDFNFGKVFTEDNKKEILDSIREEYVNGLTLLGGEPFEPENQKELLDLVLQVKDIEGKNIWAFTGYTYEYLIENKIPGVTEWLLDNIDVLIDGKFDIEQKDITLKFRGSRNQRIIDLNKTRQVNRIVLLDL